MSSDELAEGLMLVRASTLKMIRLQLAMERHDRRVALAAVDDLVALDRRMQDYLADVPGSDGRLMFRDQLDVERAELNREKLSLAAGVIRRPSEPEPEPDQPAADDWLGPIESVSETEAPQRRRRWRLALAIPALATAVAGGAYAASPDQALAWLHQAVAVFR